MKSALAHAVAAPSILEGKAVALRVADEDKALVLRLVRDAITESGWKHEAVAAAMRASTGRSIDGPYLSKMLAGEKAFPLELLRALPDEIEALVAQRYAESFGQIVVAPAESRDDALRHLVRGLFGVLAGQLPAKADRMARATVSVTRKDGE